MSEIHKKRIHTLRRIMEKRDLDMLLILTADEHGSEYIDRHFAFREYMSGFTGSAGSLLVTKEEAVLFTDGRYFLQAQEQLKGSDIRLERVGTKGALEPYQYIEKIAAGADTCDNVLRAGMDLKVFSVKQYERLSRIKGVEIIDTDITDEIWEDRPGATANPVYSLPVNVCGVSFMDKLKDVRTKLAKYGGDAVLVSGLGDVMWLFNIRGSDIEYNPVAMTYGYIDENSANIYVKEGCTDKKLRAEFEKAGVIICKYEDFEDEIKKIRGKHILCDRDSLNAHIAKILSDNDIIYADFGELIPKHIKNITECEQARKWHIEDGLILTRFIYKIKTLINSGEIINEYEAARILDDMRRSVKGNHDLSFETISAYGSNAAIIHYSPSSKGSKQLAKEGFLLVDSGGQYEGATTDVTRTLALGKLTKEMKEDYTAVLKGMLELSEAVFLEGTRGENLDILAREPIWERYRDYRHGTGHGVGAMLNVHEGPQAFRYRISDSLPQPPLKPGMITSDEPGIYIDGKYGIRIENLLLCIEKAENEWGRFLGFETLTLVPYEREAIIKEHLTLKQIKLINTYNRTVYETYKDRLESDEKTWLNSVTAPL
ncbi:MAG: aminopeptidase P family protein [Lachnospiraceae bacterium]|nr:aminopeptidase P family protein [Lachnospiraceae bacterium]